MKKNNNLRFAVMSNSLYLAEWQVECIKKLLEKPEIHLELLILNNNSSNFIMKIRNIKPNNLFYFFARLFFFKAKARKKNDYLLSLDKIKKISCTTIRKGKYSEYFLPEDVNKIKDMNLDFILRFGFGIIRGDILNSTHYGIWSFHHGDELKYRGSPPCFWEIFKNDNITGAILQKLTNRLDGGIILKKGYFKTINYSYNKNINNVFFQSAKWPVQVCNDILNNHSSYLFAEPSPTNSPIYMVPNNLQMIQMGFLLLKNFIVKLWQFLFIEDEWNIGIIENPVTDLLKENYQPTINWFPALPKNTFRADPSIIHYDNDYYILYEFFNYYQYKANFCFSRFSQNKIQVIDEECLNTDKHLSYPFLFIHENQTFLVPECWQSNSITLYRANPFPYNWKIEKVLINNFPGIDNTIIRHKNLWWLFCTNKNEGSRLNLYLFYSEQLLGDWKPHKNNPVKTNVTSSRPAGNLFYIGNELYRPAQDSSQTYGGQVVLCKIKTLTPEAFEEEIVNTINVKNEKLYNKGIHTISSYNSFMVVDGKRQKFIFSAFLSKIFTTRIIHYMKRYMNE